MFLDKLFRKKSAPSTTSKEETMETNAESVIAEWKVGSGWKLSIDGTDYSDFLPDIVRRIRCIGTFGLYKMYCGYDGGTMKIVTKEMGLNEKDWIEVNDVWLSEVTKDQTTKIKIYEAFSKADGNRAVDFNHDWTYDDDFLVDWDICKDIPDRASVICHRIDSGWDYACNFLAHTISNRFKDPERSKQFLSYAIRHGIDVPHF